MTGPSGSPRSAVSGRVTLVGAGPGDPDLLTVRAVRELSSADVVFSDRLVDARILALIPPGAERVYVGKSKGEHSVPQPDIHQRMILAARAGRRVVRLKGGDPFIFGRGGEEIDALRRSGIMVEVVPGISSALGAAASALIPLTHRDIAQSVTFVTGHAALGREPDLDWVALARPNQTVVVFMGVGAAGLISARLIAAGRDPATPAAIIENATRPTERVVLGSLDRAADLIQRAGIQGPALLVIGEVAALADPSACAASALSLEVRGDPDEGSERSDLSSPAGRPRPVSSGRDRGSPPRLREADEEQPSLSDLWSMFS
jgi:uroporphyrin-III C-methyltransferase